MLKMNKTNKIKEEKNVNDVGAILIEAVEKQALFN